MDKDVVALVDRVNALPLRLRLPPKPKRSPAPNPNAPKTCPARPTLPGTSGGGQGRPEPAPADLAKAIDVKPTQVHALIAKARAEKLIVKRGKGYALKA